MRLNCLLVSLTTKVVARLDNASHGCSSWDMERIT